MVAHQGQGAELEAAFDGVFRQVEHEPATELYILNRSASDPDVLWCYEVFSSRTAFEAHRDTETVRELLPRLDKLLASREITAGQPIRGRGLAV
jgi:quinol monooxygenase YgiN